MSDRGLPRYQSHIDGNGVPPSSGEWFESEDPYTGKPWALVGRGGADDVERAVLAADRAFRDSPWRAMTPSERGRVLWRVGDAISDNAPRLAEIERRDNGKLACEVTAQVRYMADYFRYYAGLADKVESAVLPTDREGRLFVHEVLPEGRRRDHHAMELAADIDELEARACTGGRVHRRREAVRVHVRVDAGVRGVASRHRTARRRRECRYRPRRRSR
jgi:hypothetical protein